MQARRPVPRQRPPAPTVHLILADKALNSLRASGHDYCSAVGELFDNSLQANANVIRLRIFTEKRHVGRNSRKTEVVERIAIGDDGYGMDAEVLHRALQLGYSTRYNDRSGMGRFGVGAKLAGISQSQRIQIYSRQQPTCPWLYTYIDLAEIHNGSMTSIPEPSATDLPVDCKGLAGSEHGTLVVWSKTDRLAERDGGKAREASTVETELVKYTARTFRKFLDGGIRIDINDTSVRPHDPLYLMTSTLFHQGPNPDPVATTLIEEEFDWPVPSDPGRTSKVRVTMTLLPEKFRFRRRPTDRPGGSDEAKLRRIHENEGISIMRASREVCFGYLAGIQPAIEKIKIDRWWGAEICFSPELDECFQVRNVKKGAEPIEGLRDKLESIIFKTVVTARKQLLSFWEGQEAEHHRQRGIHAEAEEIASKTKELSPKPQAGQKTTEEGRDQKIREAAEALTRDHPDRREEVEQEIRNRPVIIVPQSWPGSELLEVEHLGSTAIVKLNVRHPFYREVYAKLLAAIEQPQPDDALNGHGGIAQLAQVGLDLLILAYARAEGMRTDACEYYSDLRSYWSVHLKNMVQEWKKT
ncbi:MAG TPA: ATP-binding protein [Gemmataceae bacterium]|nr:ATP-binding protein [Gemmataceae bacterium]